MKPLEKAISAADSLADFARRVGESPQNIQNWRKRGVPAEKCRAIEAAFPGVVTATDLRPDVFGEPHPQTESGEAAA